MLDPLAEDDQLSFHRIGNGIVLRQKDVSRELKTLQVGPLENGQGVSHEWVSDFSGEGGEAGLCILPFRGTLELTADLSTFRMRVGTHSQSTSNHTTRPFWSPRWPHRVASDSTMPRPRPETA